MIAVAVTPTPLYRLWFTYAALFVLGVIVGAMSAIVFLRCLVQHVTAQLGG